MALEQPAFTPSVNKQFLIAPSLPYNRPHIDNNHNVEARTRKNINGTKWVTEGEIPLAKKTNIGNCVSQILIMPDMQPRKETKRKKAFHYRAQEVFVDFSSEEKDTNLTIKLSNFLIPVLKKLMKDVLSL
ncbi:hypothetical protein ILUMI_04644 [Ignelater luminosus]|uniref:Uncharacterized protein n=1 Tax=Ignelater luminosus TaxID=2038154 RepID=A0A8K0DCG4_IGNLU|nr:hypothetical protein ILUMI_04644 [Ignelater luminosus]